MSIVLQGQPTRAVVCYHCHRGFDAAARAITLTCPSCYKPLRLDDVVIKGVHHAARLETCGFVVVERKGWLMATSVYAGSGLDVLGSLETKAAVAPRVLITATARWRGNLRCRQLRIDPGAAVDGGYFEVGPLVEKLSPIALDRMGRGLTPADAKALIVV